MIAGDREPASRASVVATSILMLTYKFWLVVHIFLFISLHSVSLVFPYFVVL